LKNRLIPKKINNRRAGTEDKLIETNPDLFVLIPNVVDHVWSEDADLVEWYNQNVCICINLERKEG
jgi:hypothetical protein